MHRVDTSGSVSGRFQDGNPAVGQQATQLGSAWCNDVQENLCKVIEEAGFTLEKGNADQLLAAIIALIAGVVGDGSGAVPTTRLVSTAGLATGGGALASDRTITVTAASEAEVAARVRNDVAVTPAGLVGLVSVTGSAGTMILKIGTAVVQVFSAVAVANGTTIITLPESFPTECVGAWCSGGNQVANAYDNNPFVSGRGLSQLSIYNSENMSLAVNILAIGR